MEKGCRVFGTHIGDLVSGSLMPDDCLRTKTTGAQKTIRLKTLTFISSFGSSLILTGGERLSLASFPVSDSMVASGMADFSTRPIEYEKTAHY